METVSNLTATASKLIWGEPNKTTEGEEPRSGETGDTSAGEPYDKGNEESTSTDSNNPTASSIADTPTISDATSAPKSDLPADIPTALPIRSTKSSINAADAGPTPSIAADPLQQGADRLTDEPIGDEHARIAETTKEVENATKADISGAGLKPLSEVNTAATEVGQQKESHGEEPSEKYAKSSGINVAGGDFDTANPVAGKGADPLPSTQGIHHEAPVSLDTTSKVDSKENEDISDSGSPSGSKLKGLKGRIKAKLHKNKD